MSYDAQSIILAAKHFSKTKIHPIAKSLDEMNRCPVELVPLMAEAGFFRAPYPKSVGGLGLNQNDCWEVIRALSSASAGIGLMYVVHWMAVDALIKYGSEQLKAKYLKDLIEGNLIAAFSFSETTAGSDAAAIACKALPTAQGYELIGSKFFVTNGGIADLFVVAAKTNPEAAAKGISLFLVEKETPGLEITCLADKMGFRSSTTTNLVLKKCPVAASQIIGEENKGFRIALESLVGGRLGMAALGIAIAEEAMKDALSFANHRTVFGKPLANLYSIQEKVAYMHTQIQASKALFKAACDLRDQGDDFNLAASVAKVFTAEASQKVCYEAIQIMGGHGYMRSSTVERLYRDSRLIDIGVGTSEVLRMVIGTTVLSHY